MSSATDKKDSRFPMSQRFCRFCCVRSISKSTRTHGGLRVLAVHGAHKVRHSHPTPQRTHTHTRACKHTMRRGASMASCGPCAAVDCQQSLVGGLRHRAAARGILLFMSPLPARPLPAVSVPPTPALSPAGAGDAANLRNVRAGPGTGVAGKRTRVLLSTAFPRLSTACCSAFQNTAESLTGVTIQSANTCTHAPVCMPACMTVRPCAAGKAMAYSWRTPTVAVG